MSISRLFPEAAGNTEVLERLENLSASFAQSNEDFFAKWEAFALKSPEEIRIADSNSLDLFQTHLEKTVRTLQSKKPRLMPRQSNTGSSIFRQDIKAEPTDDAGTAVSSHIVRRFNHRASGIEESQKSARTYFNLNTDISDFTKARPFNAQIRAVSTELDNEVERIIEAVASAFNLNRSDFMNPGQISQNVVWVVGRIVREPPQAKSIEEVEDYWQKTPRVDPKLMLLESSRRIGGGSRTQLDFGMLPESRLNDLFEGQIVVLKGKNPKGDQFVVHEIIDIPRLPLAKLQSSKQAEGPVRIAIASAPSSPSLIARLLSWATQPSLPISALVLVGPLLKSNASLEERQQVRSTLHGLNKTTQIPIVLVPSAEDAFTTDPLFPQPPYADTDLMVNQPILRVSNPCTFSVDEIAITAAGVPTLRDTQLSSPKQSFKHVLRQRRIYPVYPAPQGVNIDVSNLKLANLGSVAPNVLILPSETGASEYHIVDGVICVAIGALKNDFIMLNVSSGDTPLESRTGIDVMRLD